MQKLNGGAAFPANPNNAHCEPGMTLRDYFAAKAMQGMLGGNSPCAGWSGLAATAYAIADSMLAAREGKS